MSRPRKDALLEMWLRQLLRPARQRVRAVPTSAQLGRLRRRVAICVGMGAAGRAAA